MPDNYKKSRSDYSKYDSMTTEELEEILRLNAQDLGGENTDVDMLMYITGVIRKRKGPNPNRKTAEEAFEIFKTHYLPDAFEDETELIAEIDEDNSETGNGPQKHSEKVIAMPCWIRRLLSAAAVVAVLFVCSATANAMRYNLWEIVVQWTQETFHFSGGHSQTPTVPVQTEQREYQSLQEALDAYQISTPLAPKWLPDGYELEEIKVQVSPAQEMFWAIYKKESQIVKVQIKRYLNGDPEQIEQSDFLLEEYTSANIIYYFFENNALLRTAWVVDHFECYITGELDTEEMKTIVDSIQE